MPLAGGTRGTSAAVGACPAPGSRIPPQCDPSAAPVRPSTTHPLSALRSRTGRRTDPLALAAGSGLLSLLWASPSPAPWRTTRPSKPPGAAPLWDRPTGMQRSARRGQQRPGGARRGELPGLGTWVVSNPSRHRARRNSSLPMAPTVRPSRRANTCQCRALRIPVRRR